MNKERLIAYYNMQSEISRIQRTIFNEEFYEGNGFVWFENLHSTFHELYKLDDPSEYDLLDWFGRIVEDMEEFDYTLLTEADQKKLTDKNGQISWFSTDEKKYPYAIVKFKTIEEVADYVLKNEVK